MDLKFTTIVDFVSTYFFDGSTTLAGLAIILAAWAIIAVIMMNFKASPAYSVVPMIPVCIFMSAYGLLNDTIAIVIVLVCSVIVASEFKKVAD